MPIDRLMKVTATLLTNKCLLAINRGDRKRAQTRGSKGVTDKTEAGPLHFPADLKDTRFVSEELLENRPTKGKHGLAARRSGVAV
jgi:hypothetical protein